MTFTIFATQTSPLTTMNRFMIIFIWLTLGAFVFTSCKKQEQKQREVDQAYYDTNDAEIKKYIQDNNLNVKQVVNGTQFIPTKSLPTAQTVNDGDSIRVHFKIKLLNGNVVDTTSIIRNLPDRLLINTESIIPGLEDALRLMREGEEATIIVPSYRALGRNSTGKIPPYSVLVYELKLIEVKSEKEQIEAYIAQKGLVVAETKDEVRRVLISAGVPNTMPKDGQEIRVCYVGRLLNGTRFDQNIDSTFRVFLNQSGLIAGFTSALRMMNEGEKSIFIFPSSVAYSRQGASGTIPPYAPLLFELTFVKSEDTQLKDHFTQQAITGTTYNISGWYQKILTTGTGTQASANSKVTLKYTSTLLDGTPIAYLTNTGSSTTNQRQEDLTLSDSNYPKAPWFVKGVKEMVLTMRVGDKRQIWLTSPVAYGIDGYLNVRRRTPVMYEVEMISVN